MRSLDQIYLAGDTIPTTGIYTTRHTGHQGSSQVILIKGHSFPPCGRCGFAVMFELQESVKLSEGSPIILLHIPDTEE